MLSGWVVVTARKRRWIVASVAAAGLITAGFVSFAARIPISANVLRSRVVSALSERLNAEVELGDLTLRLIPGLHAEADGLLIRYQGRRDVPPLIAVDTVSIDADLIGLWRKHVARVNLGGLAISIPPGGVRNDNAAPRRGDSGSVGTAGGADPHGLDDSQGDLGREVVIDELVADNSSLTILRDNPAKQPRVWSMHKLTMTSVSARTAMPYRSVLTNAVPPGTIDTTGSFGPWHRDDPGHTPIEGSFTFDDANLSVFKGISGILSAKGTYDGTLERIDVNGDTYTPDFTVTMSGHPVPLTAT